MPLLQESTPKRGEWCFLKRIAGKVLETAKNWRTELIILKDHIMFKTEPKLRNFKKCLINTFYVFYVGYKFYNFQEIGVSVQRGVAYLV